MSRSTDTTAGHRSRGPQGFPDDVPPSVVRQANRALQRWLNGEVDKMEAVSTPSGDRIVETYDRQGGKS